MMKSIRRLLCVALIAALLASMLPAGAISEYFFNKHTDWHFDLTREPNRAMTVEELIALSTAYSYWGTGRTDGTLPKDKNGKLPSDWAAPYIREENRKTTFDPTRIAYDEPATLAFWMQFVARCKGLYSYNARNLYTFSGAQGLDPEQIMLMSAAVDYGLVPYRQNMDVSVTLPRKDLENKYMIPAGELKEPAAIIRRANNCKWSMLFFEDNYNEIEKTREQLEIVKKYEGSFNLINLDVLAFQADGSDGHFVSISSSRPPDSIGFNPYHMELIEYCRQKGITIVAGAVTNKETAMKVLKENPAYVDKAAQELVDYVDKYKLDGLDLTIEFFDDTYRSTYSQLIRALSKLLHARNKLLIATVGTFAKSSSEARSPYDYKVINECADLVTLTLYDDHSARTYKYFDKPEGELSDFEFLQRRLVYAIANFGAEKVILSVGTYGVDYNLTKRDAEGIPRQEVFARMARYGAKARTHGMPKDDAYYEYTDADGSSHIVYYDSDDGLQRRLELAPMYGIAGVDFFHAGCDAPKAYAQAEEYLHALPFIDVKKGWYYDGVKWASENGVTTGTSPTTFSPDAGCTRAQVVTFLWRTAGSPAPSKPAGFTDVKDGAYYAKAVAWAVEQGVTNGMTPTTFAPDATCTRGQIVTFLWRAAGCPEAAKPAGFTDVKAEAFYAKAVAWAVEKGVTNGMTPTTFAPNDTCTRAQVVTFLYRSRK